MTQQKIVADPQAKPTITFELLEDVGALNVTAGHLRTLARSIEQRLNEMLDWAKKQPRFHHFAEWDEARHFLEMIEEKADYVEEVAGRVTAAELEDYRLRNQQD